MDDHKWINHLRLASGPLLSGHNQLVILHDQHVRLDELWPHYSQINQYIFRPILFHCKNVEWEWVHKNIIINNYDLDTLSASVNCNKCKFQVRKIKLFSSLMYSEELFKFNGFSSFIRPGSRWMLSTIVFMAAYIESECVGFHIRQCKILNCIMNLPTNWFMMASVNDFPFSKLFVINSDALVLAKCFPKFWTIRTVNVLW